MGISSLCMFGPVALNYPRNRIVRRGLAANGVSVRECLVPNTLRSPLRQVALVSRFAADPALRASDAIYVPEFAQTTVPLAWALARLTRKRLVVDLFVSHYHAAVHETRRIAPHSLRARYYRLADWLALRLADGVVVDTAQHKEFLSADFHVPAAKFAVAYVGYDDTVFEKQPAPDGDGFTVLFYGSYLALHGVDCILDAAHLLQGCSDIRFALIGGGPLYSVLRRAADEQGLTNVEFVPRVPYAELPAWIAAASVCLGIFGQTPQAQRVIPNKVFQCTAMGRPVITLDSPALREAYRPGVDLLTVGGGDSRALAEAILLLYHDADRRSAIAESGYRVTSARFAPRAIGQALRQEMAVMLA